MIRDLILNETSPIEKKNGGMRNRGRMGIGEWDFHMLIDCGRSPDGGRETPPRRTRAKEMHQITT